MKERRVQIENIGRMARIVAEMALGWARLATIGLLPAAGAVFAQPAPDPAARPAFEVSSIKRSTDPIAGVLRVEHGNFTYGNGLRFLIAWAHGVPIQQVVAPEWTMQANTVVSAKAGSPVADDQVRLMLQTLLEDRFKLRVHRETQETSVAALMVAEKNAPQLKESESQKRHLVYDSEKQQEIFTGYTMKEFVEWLAWFYQGAAGVRRGGSNRKVSCGELTGAARFRAVVCRSAERIGSDPRQSQSAITSRKAWPA